MVTVTAEGLLRRQQPAIDGDHHGHRTWTSHPEITRGRSGDNGHWQEWTTPRTGDRHGGNVQRPPGRMSANAMWSLEGDDAGQFSITNGMLMFMTAPDYEMPMDMGGDNMYMVTVTVTADDGTNMDTQDVTVTVTNVVEDTTPVTGGTLLERFDTDVNGEIDKSEVIMAINDFLDDIGGATKKDVIDVINLYLDSR